MEQKLTFEDIPEAIQAQSSRLERIERLIQENTKPDQIKSKKRFTLPEAAAYCRMAVPTFRTYLAKREVSGIKFGKSWVFTEEDLDKFLNKYRVRTADELKESADDYLK